MKTHLFILFFGVCITTQLFSQINNPDTLFKKARYYSSQKEYDSAIKIIQLLIQEFPDNDDYKIFLGRVYSWQGNYNRSLEVLLPILNADSMNMSALEAIINAYLLAEKYLEVIHYCNIGLRKSNNDFLFFAFKKSFALEKMEKNKEALLLIDTILKNHSDCEEALALRTFIYQKKKRTFSLSYHNTSFTNPALQPWHLMYLEYKQNIRQIPSVFRLNYGNMYMKSEGQFEVDLYPKLTLSSYLYLNAGASEGKYIFPQIRGGIEYYKNVNKTDLSIGVRYLRFKSTQVTLATGQISSTIRNWIISYRPFVSVVGKNLYPSHTFIFKIPNEVKEAFLQFDIQYGNVPYNFYFLNEFVRVNSIRAGIQCQFRIKSSVFIRPVFMYEYEEYYPEKYRNRYNSQIIITKRI